MSNNSAIEWTDATWNPTTGCTKVSEGCRNCYALKFAERFRGTPGHYFEHGFDVMLRHDKLELPLMWKKPKKVFVNSMSDLFHEQVPDEFIEQVFAVMSATPQHTYQILTKRPKRMLEWFTHNRAIFVAGAAHQMGHRPPQVTWDEWWPLANVWLGVSVENQQTADERIPLLLQTPAAVRFLSCEPLLGPVSLAGFDGKIYRPWLDSIAWRVDIDWVIAGGESGPNARPMHPDWVRSLRDECTSAGVAFFFKQWGEWLPNAQDYDANPGDFDYERKHIMVGDIPMCRAGKKKAGRKIDGRTWDEFPVVQ